MTAPAVWTPSLARTAWATAPGASQRGVRVAQSSLRWTAKAAADQLDYTLNIAAWLADAADSVQQLSVSVAPSGGAQDLAVGWQSLVGGNVTVFLTGGVAHTVYTVSVQVGTVAGRTALFDVSLPVSGNT